MSADRAHHLKVVPITIGDACGEAGGGSWSRSSRPRVDRHPTQTKLRWEAPAA